MVEIRKYKNVEYVFRTPDDFDESKKYPVMLYIHGAGGLGQGAEFLKNNFAVNTKLDLNSLQMIVISPYCHSSTWFAMFEQLVDFVEFIPMEAYADPHRYYVMGSSMGGYTTWQLIMTKPDLFAAAVPICGGGMYWNAGTLVNLPIWAFHGELDDIVYPCESKHMVDAVNKFGGNAKLTIVPGVAHNAWDTALASKELFDWMKSKTR